MNYRARQDRLANELTKRRLDALVVTHAANVRYLCGFTGSAGVLVAAEGRPVLVTDGRYTEQARKETAAARVVIARGSLLAEAVRHVPRRAVVGIEAERLSVAAQAVLRQALRSGVRLRATLQLVEQLRMIKEPEEVERIRRAVRLTSSLFPKVLKALRPGRSEKEVAAELEYAARKAGAEAMSFPTIVAAGPRSALPHGVASAQRVPQRGFVVLDFGVILGGYCSDMTRTVHVGRPNRREQAVYQAVQEAQQAALEAMGPGVAAEAVDAAARRVLTRAGLGRYFTHSTGHGLGLEIHEAPRLGRRQRERLEAGMVVTVEPGAYLPGRGGVRIEDVVAVTERGREVLTPTTKELIVL